MLVGLILASGAITGCASTSSEEQAQAVQQQDAGDPRDPLEPVNRVVWDFNWEVLDAYVLRPVTVGYVTVVPQFARTGLLNAAENLEEPGNFFNNLLQGKFDQGMDSLARFLINSTVGLLGTIDVADKMGITVKEEDFGEVLGVWGIGTGPYLMVPAAGPSDPRSFTGRVVDNMYYPLTILNSNFTLARWVVSALEGRAALIDQEKQLEQSVDDYAFVKNAYFQNLEYKVTDGKSGDKAIEEDQLDDFAEFESMLGEMDAPEPVEEEQLEEAEKEN
ncbi:VacJ family lipoprotein [Alteromonas pelagimontana]|uniref:VacJ family lipoprotein n=2 Tax=Alteromonas pelagimontana TaxID=1858656 RepID=A0A6M4MI56_9ALTE|nr:VacJ family lipoprotein [Alteromonas pelagimontana]